LRLACPRRRARLNACNRSEVKASMGIGAVVAILVFVGALAALNFYEYHRLD
jgi:hypothetical protein